MDHIAEQGFVGSSHNGLEHEPVSTQAALKIPEGEAVVDKNWKIKEHTSMGRKDDEISLRSSVKRRRMENSSLRELDGALSLEERRTCNTPPQT